MTTLPNSGLVLPTRGSAGSGLWADAIDAAFGIFDGHDHSSGRGARVPTAGISINADLSFGSSYGAKDLQRLSFASVAALSSNNKSLFVSSADNELYWRSNAGNNVKLTSGSQLNVSAFTGGIAGDYTAVSAQVAFDDAGDRYTFKQNGATGWARMASGEVRILETGTSETVYVGQAAPAALAASYTVTWPTALPASTVPLNITSGGQIAFSESHGTRTLSLPPAAWVRDGATGFYTAGAGIGASVALNGAFTAYAPITLPVGSRILAVRVYMADSGVGPTKGQASFQSSASAGGAVTTIGSSAVSAGTAANQTLTIGSLTTTMVTGTAYTVKYTTTTGTDSNAIFHAEVDYDRP